MLFGTYKWMSEECSEYTQSDPAPSELGVSVQTLTSV